MDADRLSRVLIAAVPLAFALAACGTDQFEDQDASQDGSADRSDDHKIGVKFDGSDQDVTDATSTGDAATDAPLATFKRAFITSATYLANLGGIAGADAKCQAAATKAGLTGTYMAWLSTPTSSPSTRFTTSNVPYKMLDGTTLAASYQSMTSLGTLLHAIDRDENNNAIVFDAQSARGVAWTQTKPDGTYRSPGGCFDFTSTATDDAFAGCDNSTSSWSVCGDYGCALVGAQAAGLSLYCFEQ